MGKMKIWIATDSHDDEEFVKITDETPRVWRSSDNSWKYPEKYFIMCRATIEPLLRGTGKRLPKHGSKDVVELEVSAK